MNILEYLGCFLIALAIMCVIGIAVTVYDIIQDYWYKIHMLERKCEMLSLEIQTLRMRIGDRNESDDRY